mgnify:CR=1 FL=1
MINSIVERYTNRVNDLQRIHNISPRKGAAASGEVFEQLVDDVVRKHPNLLSLKNDYLTVECDGFKMNNVQVDRHIRDYVIGGSGNIRSVIECKTYLDACYCKRAVLDFIEIAESSEVDDTVDFVIVCGQLTIAKDTLAYYQAFCKKHTGRNFQLFVLNDEKKRNSKRPLYKEKFTLDSQELGRFNEYIASF